VPPPRAPEFAQDLECFLNPALPSPVEFALVETETSLRIGPRSPSNAATSFGLVPLGDGDLAPLLKVEYKLADDPSGEYCRVLTSTFGLFVPTETNGRRGSWPVIRLEFERTQTPPAHVHFHTASQTLGWLYGIAGGAYRPPQDLHFPVGSQRFRPTIEDFLLFLHRERLFRSWRKDTDWKSQARKRLDEYERRQAIAVVKHFAHDVADELRSLGWTITPPGGA